MWKVGVNKILRSLLVTTTMASAAGAIGAGSAFAAEQAASSNNMVLEEITVTARKREEKLQDVPDSIVVLTAEKLELTNTNTLHDFVRLTPNLFVRETFRPNETFLTMRGISSAQGSLPPVAFIVDGVQYGSNDFINQDLLDVQRIEVLRGPQGALYGQGAIAGAINIVTKQPSNDFEAFIKGTYGNGNATRIAATLSGPIVKDRWFARVSAYYKYSDGLIYNHYLKKDIDSVDMASGRLKLDYRGDRLKIQINGSYTKGNQSCCFLDHAPHDANFNYNFVDANGVYHSVDDVNEPGPDTDIQGKTWDTFGTVSLKVDYDFDGFTATSISGYNHVLEDAYGDADYSSNPAVAQDLHFRTNVVNQELRFTSNDSGRVHWIFGSYYQERSENQDILVGNEPPAPFGKEPGHLDPFLHIDTHDKRKLWSLFGTADIDITNDLTLTLAARYDHDQQHSEDFQLDGSYKEATFKKFQPKAVLSYHWTPDFLIYTSYATGFRPGGYSQNQQFDNEVTKNYEIGFKSTVMDGLLSVNGAAYHIDYQNQQISFVQFMFDDSAPGGFIVQKGVVNVKRSQVNGMELEMVAQPTDRLNLSMGIGVSDSVAKEIEPNILFSAESINSLIGNKSPLVTTYTFNLGGTYTQPVTGNMDLVLRADFRQEGPYYHDLGNTVKSSAHNYLSGRLALESTAGWVVAVYGRNLTNSRAALYVNPVSGVRMPNQPRSYGVEASFRY